MKIVENIIDIAKKSNTKTVKIGNTMIGGGSDILIQSMTNTFTEDIKSTILQIKELEKVGAEIIRLAVPNMEAACSLDEIIRQSRVPLVADIHFDYRLALQAIKSGISKIRLNPGNIGSEDRIKEVVFAAKDAGVPIRIGVNSGSLQKDILQKEGGVTANGLVESALRHVAILERYGFNDIVISLKSSSIKLNTESYRILSKKVNYPLHIGITEAGTEYSGTIKSAAGLGILLYDGIGDTLRVSLAADPIKEIKVAKTLLQSLELRNFGINVVACPTCGRTKVDLISLAEKVEQAVSHIEKNLTVAVMGCVVNGPGEAREADIGVAGGNGEYLLFSKGIPLKKVKESEVLASLIEEIEKYEK